MKKTLALIGSFLILALNIGFSGCDSSGVSTTNSPIPIANFEHSNFVLTPDKLKGGENITASIDIKNSGNAGGNYTLNLKIDSTQFETKTINLAANTTQKVEFSFTKTEPGKHDVEINGSTASFIVLKPANIKLSNLLLSPEKVRAGWGSTVTVDVFNGGEIEGSQNIVLKVNGSKFDSKSITLSPDARQTVSFNVVEDVGGPYTIGVDSFSKTLTVSEGVVPVYHTGDKWVYRFTSQGIMYTKTETITGEETIDGKSCYVVKRTYDPKYGGLISEETTWWDKSTALSIRSQITVEASGQSVTSTLISSQNVTGSALWPMAVNNESTVVMNGKTVTMASGKSSTKESTSTITVKVEKAESITTNAGTFRTLKSVTYSSDGKVTSEQWYSDKAQATVKSTTIKNGTPSGDGEELLSYSVKDGGL
jgi:hypothetical protein